jgi:hypothetical protein
LHRRQNKKASTKSIKIGAWYAAAAIRFDACTEKTDATRRIRLQMVDIPHTRPLCDSKKSAMVLSVRGVYVLLSLTVWTVSEAVV